jgi:hypothetical protein
MLENFRQWYLRNYKEITWFLIGFLIMAACVNVGQGDYVGAVMFVIIAWINYFFVKNKL